MRFIPGKLFAIIVIVEESGIEGNVIFGKLVFGGKLLLSADKLFKCVNVFGSEVIKLVVATVETA